MQTTFTLGIDEAGRGPILGPMVMACVGLSEIASQVLLAQGIMDSKRFGAGPAAHRKRLALLPAIYQAAEFVSARVIEVAEIDQRVWLGELNRLEQEKALELIKRAPAASAIVADGAHLFAPLQTEYPHLQAVDRGESAHVAVAAASIVAKTARDEAWLRIVAKYRPEFGSLVEAGGGYANAGTKRFLRAYCEKYHKIPPEGRRSWPWDFVSDLLESDEYEELVWKMAYKKQGKREGAYEVLAHQK